MGFEEEVVGGGVPGEGFVEVVAFEVEVESDWDNVLASGHWRGVVVKGGRLRVLRHCEGGLVKSP